MDITPLPPQWPLSLVPNVATVERFESTRISFRDGQRVPSILMCQAGLHILGF